MWNLSKTFWNLRWDTTFQPSSERRAHNLDTPPQESCFWLRRKMRHYKGSVICCPCNGLKVAWRLEVISRSEHSSYWIGRHIRVPCCYHVHNQSGIVKHATACKRQGWVLFLKYLLQSARTIRICHSHSELYLA